MTAKNEGTGDFIRTKPSSEKFRKNFDTIFNKKNYRNLSNTQIVSIPPDKKYPTSTQSP